MDEQKPQQVAEPYKVPAESNSTEMISQNNLQIEVLSSVDNSISEESNICPENDTKKSSNVSLLQEVWVHIDKIIDAVARGGGVDEGLLTNELSSRREEYANVPTPSKEHPELEEAHGTECSSSIARKTLTKKSYFARKENKMLENYEKTQFKPKGKNSPETLSSTSSFAKIRKVSQYASSQETLPSEILSQSSDGLLSRKLPSKPDDRRLKMLHLQRMRCETGIWVQCVSCNKWRYLATINDAQSVHPKWKCSMNSDPEFNSCSVEQVGPDAEEEEFMVHCSYTVGSLVWVQMAGYPWWPAMVDDDPDYQQFYWLNDYSDIPTYYNVVYFDSQPVTRSWVTPQAMQPFKGQAHDKELCEVMGIGKKMQKRLTVAIRDAERATFMNVSQRLQEFSFVSRYLGKIGKKRKKTSKSQRKMKKMREQLLLDSDCDGEFSDTSAESSLCSEESYELRTAQMMSLSQESNVKSKSRRRTNKNKPTAQISSQSSSESSDEDSTCTSSTPSSSDDNEFKCTQGSVTKYLDPPKCNKTKNNGKMKPESLANKKAKVSATSKKVQRYTEFELHSPITTNITQKKIKKDISPKKVASFIKSNEGNKSSTISKSLHAKQPTLHSDITDQRKSSQGGQILNPRPKVSSSPMKNQIQETEDQAKVKTMKKQGNKSEKNTAPKAKFCKSNFIKPKEKTQLKKHGSPSKNDVTDSGQSETNKLVPTFKSVKKQKKSIIKAGGIASKSVPAIDTSKENCEDFQDPCDIAEANLSPEKAVGEIETNPTSNVVPDTTPVKSKKRKVPQFTVPKKQATDTNSVAITRNNVENETQEEVASISQNKENTGDEEVEKIDNIEEDTSSMETSPTVELPQQEDQATAVEPPNCGEVIIEDPFISLSQENLNFFRSSSPLFDMEE